MFGTVICAIGRGSRQRMLQLIEMAREQLVPNGSLHLVHAVEGLPSSTSPDDWAVSVLSDAESRLMEALRSTGATASVHVRAGNPSEVIVSIAKEVGANLIVICAHRDDVLEQVVGSVTDHVVQRAPCSVLVARIAR